MRDDQGSSALGAGETVSIAGVAVPTSCSDRVDAEVLADAVAVLEEHGVRHYTVSPVGGLKIRIGVHRPTDVHAAVRSSLARVGSEVTEHGTAKGFRRLRLDVTTPPDDGDGTRRD